MLNRYYDKKRVAEKIRNNQHRSLVGGLWHELGSLQIQYLKNQGLSPDTRLLDVGCGCFRAGVHAIGFLEPGNYYGIDISQDLMQAGYEKELRTAGLATRMPVSNMAVTNDFNMKSFGVDFDYFIAQSLFTHLPLNHLVLCLKRAEAVAQPSARFFATFFICARPEQWFGPIKHESGVTTYPNRDPYHYYREHIEFAAERTSWTLDFIEDWNHPRGQAIAGFSLPAPD